MRELRPNEKIIKEYTDFVLVEVACPDGKSYRTTIPKWQQVDYGQGSIKYDMESRLDKHEYKFEEE